MSKIQKLEFYSFFILSQTNLVFELIPMQEIKFADITCDFNCLVRTIFPVLKSKEQNFMDF